MALKMQCSMLLTFILVNFGGALVITNPTSKDEPLISTDSTSEDEPKDEPLISTDSTSEDEPKDEPLISTDSTSEDEPLNTTNSTSKDEPLNITNSTSKAPLIAFGPMPEDVHRLVIDIGAGFHPMVNESDALLVLIEPQKKAADMLKDKFKGNNKVYVLQMALSNFTGIANLSHYMLEGRMSSLAKPNGWSKVNKENYELVNVTTLQEVIECLPLESFNDKIDYMQIDAQGEDFNIVKSANYHIKKVNKITAEVNKDGFRTYYTDNSEHFDWAPLMKQFGLSKVDCKEGFHKNSYGFHAAEMHCTWQNPKPQ